MSKPTGSNKDQFEATRSLFMQIAHDHFVNSGYNGTSTNDIVREADMARGALYHHFKGKDDLFRQVLEAKLQEMHRRADEYINDKLADQVLTEQDLLFMSMDFMIDLCRDKSYRRIILLESQVALSHRVRRDIMAEYQFPFFINAFEKIGITEQIDDTTVETLVIGLTGMIAETVRSFEYTENDEELHNCSENMKHMIRLLLKPFIAAYSKK